MAEIRPFRGVRYDPAVTGDLAAVVSAPYDIISPEAQAAYYARSRYNVISLELGSQLVTDDQIDNRYTRASATYRRWKEDRALKSDPLAGFYLYEEEFDDRGERFVRRSLFAPVRLADWDEKVVLPHEFTMPGPKVDRLNLLNLTHAQFSPLLAMYDEPGPLRGLLSDVASRPPTVSFTLAPGSVAAAARTHRLWYVADGDVVGSIVDAFRALQIYIADGHHRYETALVYRDQQRRAGATEDAPSEFVLMALVETSDPGLLILPTHRLLNGLGPIDPATALRRLSESFEVERIRSEEVSLETPVIFAEKRGRPSFTVLGLEAGWAHRLTLRASVDLSRELPNVPAVLRDLDTVVLQRLIFERVLGLSDADVERGERIQYTRDPREAMSALADGRAQLAVFLAPTPMDQLRAATRAGERMPQKSTYFYPKPVTGTVFFDHETAFTRGQDGI